MRDLLMQLGSAIRQNPAAHALGLLGGNLLFAGFFIGSGFLRPWLELGQVGAAACSAVGAAFVALAALRLQRQGPLS
jgi:hypothetical protein